MQNRTILLKLGEIVLKGMNRGYFERLLMERIRARLDKTIGVYECFHMQSTFYVTPESDGDIEPAYEQLKRIFGVVSLAIAYRAPKDMESILDAATTYMAPLIRRFSSFKVDAKRSDKTFPYPSPRIMALVGEALVNAVPEIRVDVVAPQITVMVEIREQYAYLHAGSDRGAGGMPYGSGGRGLLLLSGGIDSPVAGYMLAKRGVEIDALHFESYPYTSELAKEKVVSLARILCNYTDRIRLHFISLTEVQEQIRKHCAEDCFTLIVRRFMMELAQRCALRAKCGALITGESLGQVASQTMAAIGVTDNVCSMPVFRPCIGMDKEEIVAIARKIDTFETSILPYEDCCTIFTPKHPKTNPKLDDLLREEARLDKAALLDRAFATLDTLLLK